MSERQCSESGHCWHTDREFVAILPPIYGTVCCWCGEVGRAEREHGPRHTLDPFRDEGVQDKEGYRHLTFPGGIIGVSKIEPGLTSEFWKAEAERAMAALRLTGEASKSASPLAPPPSLIQRLQDDE
jgi:hypothetical protein